MKPQVLFRDETLLAQPIKVEHVVSLHKYYEDAILKALHQKPPHVPAPKWTSRPSRVRAQRFREANEISFGTRVDHVESSLAEG